MRHAVQRLQEMDSSSPLLTRRRPARRIWRAGAFARRQAATQAENQREELAAARGVGAEVTADGVRGLHEQLEYEAYSRALRRPSRRFWRMGAFAIRSVARRAESRSEELASVRAIASAVFLRWGEGLR